MKKHIIVAKEDAEAIVAAINAGELRSVKAFSARIVPSGARIFPLIGVIPIEKLDELIGTIRSALATLHWAKLGQWGLKRRNAIKCACDIVAFLIRYAPRKPIALLSIAEGCYIPSRFLLTIIKPLLERGLLLYVKGPQGGYRLAKPPEEIMITDIIEAIEGKQLPSEIRDKLWALLRNDSEWQDGKGR